MKITAAIALCLTPFVASCATSGPAAPDGTAATGSTPAPVFKPAPGIESFAAPYKTTGSIEKLDPALDAIIDTQAPIEMLARGFGWSEGPIWVANPAGNYLLFSDVPKNTMYRWREGEGVSVFLQPSGGPESVGEDAQGSNGLAIDAQGRLVMCQHGTRRLAYLNDLSDPSRGETPVAERYEGKRFSSPNDLILAANGDIYFTDPPYGLGKEVKPDIAFNGVFRRTGDGSISVVDDSLERPNGIILSPDGKTLYVANSEGKNPIWKAYDVAADGTTSNARVFFDAKELAAAGRVGGNDGIAVDVNGNLFATGPGGVLIFSPQGKHLGTIMPGIRTANCKFGDDGTTLYLTSKDHLLRVKTKSRGLGF